MQDALKNQIVQVDNRTESIRNETKQVEGFIAQSRARREEVEAQNAILEKNLQKAQKRVSTPR